MNLCNLQSDTKIGAMHARPICNSSSQVAIALRGQYPQAKAVEFNILFALNWPKARGSQRIRM